MGGIIAGGQVHTHTFSLGVSKQLYIGGQMGGIIAGGKVHTQGMKRLWLRLLGYYQLVPDAQELVQVNPWPVEGHDGTGHDHRHSLLLYQSLLGRGEVMTQLQL